MGTELEFEELHRLLRRQLRKAGVVERSDPVPDHEAFQELIASVHRAYVDADSDRYTLERSLDLSSTEMAELHGRLEAEHDRLLTVMRAVGSAIIHVDAQGQVVFCNPAAHTLLRCDQDVGGSLFEAVELREGRGMPLHPSQLQDENAEPMWVHDGTIVLNDATTLAAAWHLQPLSRHGWVLTVTDLTPLKAAERDAQHARVEAEVARRSERARGQFLANMSHELRTPLNAIIGYTEILLEDWAVGSPEATTDLSRVLGSARHLLGIINDVLDLSKVDAGRMEIHAEDFDLHELIRSTVSSSQVLVARNGNVLETSLDPAAREMRSDAQKIRQCVLNLLSNAAKFTRGGRIDIEVVREGPLVLITVRDNGPGIPKEKQAYLFDAFMQADASTTKEFGGTGLGLTLTRRFCEILGGSVVLESTVGVGSAFTLRLPMRFEFPAVADADGVVWHRGHGEAVVLVVDDDATVFDLVSRLLSPDAVRFVGVPTAEQTMAMAIELKPAVIVLDVWLPGVNGWMALRELREDPRTAAIPVIVISSDDRRRVAADLSADAFVSKPLDRAALSALLSRFLP